MQKVIVHDTDVSIRLSDYFIEFEVRIGLDESLSNHKLNSLTRLVQIDLPEEFEAAIEYQVDVVIDFPVVRDLVVDDLRVAQDSLVINERFVDIRMHQVSIQIIKLVQVERVALVCDDIEKEALLIIIARIMCRLTFDQILDQLAIRLSQFAQSVLI